MRRRICGVDEVGRGPLAGPVVAAACVFAEGYQHKKINDSKQLSEKMREVLVSEIERDALEWAIVAVGPEQVDRLNIREATKLAMTLAARRILADLVLVDGNMGFPCSVELRTVIDGDAKHVEISAASILAKVWRDRLMRHYAERYPQYGFDSHARYGTAAHRRAISEYGPSPIHRCTFSGVREFVVEPPEPPRSAVLAQNL